MLYVVTRQEIKLYIYTIQIIMPIDPDPGFIGFQFMA